MKVFIYLLNIWIKYGFVFTQFPEETKGKDVYRNELR